MKKITLKLLIIAISIFGINAHAQNCAVSGAGAYNADGVTTTGGSTNISYDGTGVIDDYLSISQTITAAVGGTFNIAVLNSNGWSRSVAWIDWNGDGDFDDAGEQLPPFSAEKLYSGDPGVEYNQDVTVPGAAVVGSTKIRILTGDAWAYNDDMTGADPDGPGIPVSPCGDFVSGTWKDFDVEITAAAASYCSVTGAGAYNADGVTTTGGATNISYDGTGVIDGYLSISQTITAAIGGTFNIAVLNSNGWSRSVAWIDWNGDGDFDDAGEQLPPFSAEKLYSGDPGVEYNQDVTVPGAAVVGSTKIRILTGDAWAYNDDMTGADPDGPGIPVSPCGDFVSGTWKDFDVEIESALGVNDLSNNLNFSVYPNPMKGESINLRMNVQNQKVDVKLYNITGKLVFETQYKSFAGSEELSLSSLVRGIYLLNVKTENGSFTKKIVK